MLSTAGNPALLPALFDATIALPRSYDGACRQINVTYAIETRRVVSVACNPRG